MAPAPVEGDGRGESGENGQGGLFQGMSFWLSHQVPQRKRFMKEIKENGGTVKLIEKDANVLIVDHAKKNLPPNTYSYKFIEKSVQRGILQDLEDHKAGPSSARPAGATNIPAKGRRLPFSIQDDQLIYDYMHQRENTGASMQGNIIYQEFAEMHLGHTWQSWRDRYIKRVRGRPRPGGNIETAPATTVSEQARRDITQSGASSRTTQDQRPQRPLERKRKRSPEPPTNDRWSNSTSIAQQKAADRASSRRPEVVIPLEPPTRRREPSHHEAHFSPKKAKAITKPAPEKPQSPEPVLELDLGVDSAFLELPFLPSPPRTTHRAPTQDIDSWIDERLRSGKGKEDQIINSLCCTSMDPELADVVLDSLIAGKGMPTDMRGVWTAEDDRCLEAQDTRDVQRVIGKHGDLLQHRWDYLNLTRA